jgi:hypothetical protein
MRLRGAEISDAAIAALSPRLAGGTAAIAGPDDTAPALFQKAPPDAAR